MNLRHNIGNCQSAQTSGGSSRLSGRRVGAVFQLLPGCVSDCKSFPTFGSCPSQCARVFRERTEEMFLLVFNGLSLGERGTFVSHMSHVPEKWLVITCNAAQRLRFLTRLPLYETVSPLAPHSSTTAPGTGGPVGPFSPPLEDLLLQENTQGAKTRRSNKFE